MPASPADDGVSLAREMDPDGVGTFGRCRSKRQVPGRPERPALEWNHWTSQRLGQGIENCEYSVWPPDARDIPVPKPSFFHPPPHHGSRMAELVSDSIGQGDDVESVALGKRSPRS